MHTRSIARAHTPSKDGMGGLQENPEPRDIIPASGRSLHKITQDRGRSCRVRPTADIQTDPFRHAAFNLINTDETERLPVVSKKSGRCRIMYCEYCTLCYEFGIDPFAYQEKLVPGGATNEHWDPYFHWIVNEQIPHFGDQSLYRESKKLGSCWIVNCEYCQLHGELGSTKQKRINTRSQTWPQTRPNVGVSKASGEKVKHPGKAPRFPFEACPRWSLKASRHVAVANRCRHCSVLGGLVEEQMGRDTHWACFTPVQEMHNNIFLRRLLFALSPLAHDWETEPLPGDDLLWKNQVLVTEIDLSFPTHIRFAPDTEHPNSGEKGRWTQPRAPSPYPVKRPERTPSPYPAMPSRGPGTARGRAANAERDRLFLTIPGSADLQPHTRGRGSGREGGTTFVSPRYSSRSPPRADRGGGGGDTKPGRGRGRHASDRLLSSARAGGQEEGCCSSGQQQQKANLFVGINHSSSPKAMSFGKDSIPTSTITAAQTRVAAAEPLGSGGGYTTITAAQQQQQQQQQCQEHHWSSSMAAWDEQDYDNSHGHAYDATTLKGNARTQEGAQEPPQKDHQRSRKGSGESVASTDTFSSSSSSAGPETPTTSTPDTSAPRARRLSWWQGFRIFVGVDKDPDICTFCGFYFPSCTCVYLDEETGQMIKASPVVE